MILTHLLTTRPLSHTNPATILHAQPTHLIITINTELPSELKLQTLQTKRLTHLRWYYLSHEVLWINPFKHPKKLSRSPTLHPPSLSHSKLGFSFPKLFFAQNHPKQIKRVSDTKTYRKTLPPTLEKKTLSLNKHCGYNPNPKPYSNPKGFAANKTKLQAQPNVEW